MRLLRLAPSAISAAPREAKGNGGFGTKDPFEASRREFLERRSALSAGYPGAVKEVVWKIDGRFHEPYLRLYG